MSQNFKIGLSLLYMSKNGKIYLFFHNYFSRFDKKNLGPKKSETWFPPNKCYLYVCEISCLGNNY